MKNTSKTLALFCSTLLILCASFSVAASSNEAIDYSLKDLDGKIHRVSDARGKWLVINFWATWCAPCLKEMPDLESFYQNQKDVAEVWGVSFEDNSIETIQEFVSKLNVNYPILGHGQAPKTGYGAVNVLPTTFIIDKQGRFYHRFEGPVSEQDIVEVINSPR